MDIDGFNCMPGRKISSNTAHVSLSVFQLGPYLTQTFITFSNRFNSTTGKARLELPRIE